MLVAANILKSYFKCYISSSRLPRKIMDFRVMDNLRFCMLLYLVCGFSEVHTNNSRRPGTCRVGELRCQNGGLCVQKEQVCDGIRQCEDGLDEYVCSPKFRRGFYRSGPKKGAVFQCQFGGLTPISRLCDGAVNCLDGSDESEICENNSCLPGYFRCQYGSCIPDWQMCNGRKNCPDGSDESPEVCQDIQCKPTEFRCRYGGCIPKTRICDIKKHCADGSDESEFLCLITRAKMVVEWEKEEKTLTDEIDQRKKADQIKNPKTSPNSVLPSTHSRYTSSIKTPSSSPNAPTTTEAPFTTVSNLDPTSPKDIANGVISQEHSPTTNPMLSTENNSNEGSDDDNAEKTQEKLVGEVENVENSSSFDTSLVAGTTTTSDLHDAEPSTESTNAETDTSNTSTTKVSNSQLTFPTTTEESNKPYTTTTAQPTLCNLPDIPENADAVVSNCMRDEQQCTDVMQSVPPGTHIQYECDAGYALYGAPIITCQDDGRWSLNPPVCEVILDVRFGLGSVIPKDFRPRCAAIVPPKGTLVECLDPTNLAVKSCSELQRPGVEARFTCKAYFRPSGDLPIHYEKCGEDGNWSPGAFQHFSCVPDCGLSELPRTPYIVNGRSIKRGQWPWHVGIYVEYEGKLTYICGGALITEHAVLTSAHCVTRHGSIVDPSKFKVFLGKQTITLPDNDPFVQSRLISKIFTEDSFNFRSLDSDIAIMALETNAVLSYFVRPVCYPQNSNSFLEEHQLAQGNLGTVLGWGSTGNQSLSHDLRMTEIPVISHADCVSAYRDFFASMTRSTNYCAGYLNGTSLCNGDSGGGQYFKAIVRGATRWYIQGLVSYGVPKEGSKQCSSSHYTVFTRVGRYADWVVRTLSRENLI